MHMQEQFGHVTVTYDEETALLQLLHQKIFRAGLLQ